MKQILVYLFIINSIFSYPVAIIHGFYDSCSNTFFTTLKKVLKYNNKNYAYCLNSGEGSESLSLSFEEQCQRACDEINQNSEFDKDFSILSISQGGLIARYLIQKCEMKGKVKKLVSFGGPMMGTSQLPFCLGGVSCFIINSIADYFVYYNYFQKNVGPAGYYKTAAHNKDFESSNSFLYNLNNPKNETEKQNFIDLESLVLIGFKKDKMISPKESAEFGKFDENFKVQRMNETEEYLNDNFGLRTLDENKKIQIHYLEGEHIEFDYNDVLKYAIPNL